MLTILGSTPSHLAWCISEINVSRLYITPTVVEPTGCVSSGLPRAPSSSRPGLRPLPRGAGGSTGAGCGVWNRVGGCTGENQRGLMWTDCSTYLPSLRLNLSCAAPPFGRWRRTGLDVWLAWTEARVCCSWPRTRGSTKTSGSACWEMTSYLSHGVTVCIRRVYLFTCAFPPA